MASYSTQYYAPAAVPIPSKAEQYQQYYQGSSGSAYSVSPSEDDQRERDASVTSGVPSYGNSSSIHGASYATSYTTSGDYGDGSATQSGASVNGVDFNDYMQSRFEESFDPIPLDRSLARQAQTSGQLNNKHRELLEMQAKAQARLAKSRARFQQGLNDAREVHADLEWTSKKVSSLKKKAEKHHAKEYQKACGLYPALN
ncbi:hypothetical protein F4811DRAFT_49332 [Daldinia bambusicola]|nr:hypothetical protein F4811DRAFT_49332 [Daldinia bambusicola]